MITHDERRPRTESRTLLRVWRIGATGGVRPATTTHVTEVTGVTRVTGVTGVTKVTRMMLCVTLCVLPAAAQALPSFDEVRADWHSSDWTLLARDGQPIQRTRIDERERRGDWIALADVSPALRQAIVVSEDKRFYEHSGVDWRGAAGAAWGNLWNTRTRGASTVTMQLTGLLDDNPQRSGQRSITQKAGQAVSALWLERSWRKDQILEAYLNLVPFRGESIGLSALSATLFGKAPSGLDEREASVAAALIRSPNAPYAKVSARACRILHDMQAGDQCAGLDSFVQLAFARPAPVTLSITRDDDLAPHFARRVAAEVHPVAGARVRSTLDANLQRFTRDTLTRTLVELNARAHPRNVQDGAAVVLDNATGEVLAWVGSSGALSGARDVDAVLALRQAGSTLKPFLYAQAIDERRLTTTSLLDDAPLDLPAGGGLYIPQNYDKDFKGWVSMRTALGSSLNVPAVRTLVMVTPHRFAMTLTALGLPLTQSGDYYGYSLALGSADVTLLSLTNAYRALANGGIAAPTRDLPHRAVSPSTPPQTPTSTSTSTQDSRTRATQRVFSPQASFIITTVLADNNARTRTFGFDSPLATRFFSAVKTGTSKDMRDNWTVGFTSRYTVGVWVGNADGTPMWDVSGVTGAAPIWAAIVGYLHRQLPDPPPVVPPNVIQTRVSFENNVEPPRTDWFMQGTQTSVVGLAANASAAAQRLSTQGAVRIGSPSDGTIFALDPDIPAARQRISFERASGASSSSTWRLDGKTLGHASSLPWLPWPGHHRLELVNANGNVADAVNFEVRGAVVRSPAAHAAHVPGAPKSPQK